jgi:multidrug efflux pump subunit AcrB
LLGIYVLVVAQFASFKLPLVILTPIPLTLVGIVLGHMLFQRAVHGHLDDRLHRAGRDHRAQLDPAGGFHPPQPARPTRPARRAARGRAIRFKPIVLTAAAAMIGAAVILTDPIFQGLAISLLFGLASSTLLTVLVIPAIYVVLRGGSRS